jgi:hypothetical protein
MNIALSKDNFSEYNIIFGSKSDNNIINDSYFYTIHYSDTNIYLNHIVYQINLEDVSLEPYYNKLKCSYIIENNTEQLQELVHLERNILGLFSSKLKPSYKIHEQLKKAFVKLTNDTNAPETDSKYNLYIKISGIWETDTEYGIIYKFFI